jgi:hypothetical protein
VKTVYVPLTGGLGNQLFQLSAALSLNPSQVILSTRYGRPRRDSNDLVEISNWNLSNNVKIEDHDDGNLIVRKTVGYLLRSGINPRRYEQNVVWRLIVKLLGTLVISLDRKRLVTIFSSGDVGYSEISRMKQKRSIFLIGYFQSYRYLTSKTPDLLSSDFESLDRETQLLFEESKMDNPICVHVRLGDYLNAEEFGTPSANYYLEAIRELSVGKDALWVFSDDIELAKEKLKELTFEKIRWFDRISESDSKTIQVMSFCSRFVLSNSTFGWWAAMISAGQNKKVICPKPWFFAMQEPEDLIPEEWTRRNADFG